ncbi:MAG TPA: hypothetical protein VJ985_03780 [Gammaproteobacteria bacterium]|nr:hypothetical protein [Gammaproteobacteria bacterium]
MLPCPVRAVLALCLLLVTPSLAAAPAIQGVYELKLGQSRAEAESALATDNRFRRIAGRFHNDFPLYEVTLGEHELRVRPAFTNDRLTEITLRFREQASPNDVGPVVLPQLRFARDTLTARFGEPDERARVIDELDRRDFRDGERVPTHSWRRGERRAQVMIWRDRFTYGAEIVLAEGRRASEEGSAAEAF